MKKIILFTSAALMFSAMSFAAPDHGKKGKCCKSKTCCSKKSGSCSKKAGSCSGKKASCHKAKA